MKLFITSLALLLIAGITPALAITYTGEGALQTTNICASYPGFTNRVVNCVKDIIDTSTADFIAGFSTLLRPIVYAVVTLSVTIFGVKLSLGGVDMRQAKTEIMMYIIKVVGVIAFTENMYPWYVMAVDATEEIMNMMTNTILGTQLANIYCTPIGDAGLGAAGSVNVWKFVDCGLGMFMGFDGLNFMSAGTPGGGGITSAISMPFAIMGVLGIIISSTLSGYIGLVMFFAGLSAVVSIIFAFIRAAFEFLSSVIALSLLMALSVLVIPGLLFQATSKYFDSWLNIVIRQIFQPMLFILVLCFMVIFYDRLMFSSTDSLFSSILCREVTREDVRNFDVYEEFPGFEENVKYMFGTITPPAFNQRLDSNIDLSQLTLPNWSSFFLPGQNNAGTMSYFTLDPMQLPESCRRLYGMSDRTQAEGGQMVMEDYMKEMMMAMLKLTVISYLFYVIFDNLPSFANDLTRTLTSGYSTPSVPSPFEGQLKGGFAAAQQTVSGIGFNKGGLSPQEMSDYMGRASTAFSNTAVKGSLIQGTDFMRNFFGSPTAPRNNPSTPPVTNAAGNTNITNPAASGTTNGVPPAANPTGSATPPTTPPAGGSASGNTGGTGGTQPPPAT